jgi:hypothetical protein
MVQVPPPASDQSFEKASMGMPALCATGLAAPTSAAKSGPRIRSAPSLSASWAAATAPWGVPLVSRGNRSNRSPETSKRASCAAFSKPCPISAEGPESGSSKATWMRPSGPPGTSGSTSTVGGGATAIPSGVWGTCACGGGAVTVGAQAGRARTARIRTQERTAERATEGLRVRSGSRERRR